jgi:hypothetical protein
MRNVTRWEIQKNKKNGMIDNQWVVYIDKSLSWD